MAERGVDDLREDTELLKELEKTLNNWTEERQHKLKKLEDLKERSILVHKELHGCHLSSRRSSFDSEDSNDPDYYDYMYGMGEYWANRRELDELTEETSEMEEDIITLNREIEDLETETLEILRPYLEDMSEGGAGNVRDEGYGATLSCVWEYFATALLQESPEYFGVEGPLTAEHSGKANDWGVDVHVYTQEPRRLIAVVQAKRGNFFSTGKGNSIVLSLIGSCVCFGTTRGIIFSNEPSARHRLKRNTCDLIKVLREKEYTVQCLFMDDIWKMVEELESKHAVLERFHTLLTHR